MKIKLSLIISLIIGSFISNAQSVDWAISTAANSSLGADVIVDPSGGSYSTGSFTGTGYFGSGNTLFSSGSYDAYVCNRDQNGVLSWVKPSPAPHADYARSIASDASGNIYVVGDFSSYIVLGTTTLTAVGGRDVFVVKMTAAGTISWARKFGGADDDYGNDIVVDPSGSIYITGDFVNVTNFGGSYFSNGGSDAYIAEILTNGALLSFQKFGSTANDYGNALTTDASGNIYFTGSISAPTVFGTYTLTPSGNDIYMAKMNPANAIQWAKNYGGSGSDNGYDIAVDASLNVYGIGSFNSSANFDAIGITSTGGSDVFISKLDANGSALWVQKGGSSANDVGSKISINSLGNIIITGEIRSGSSFGTINVSSYGLDDIFIARMNTNGNFIWAINCGSSNNDRARGIALNSSNIYAVGFYNTSGNFGSYTLNTSSGASTEAYTIKLGLCAPSSSTVTTSSCNSYLYNSQTYTTSGVYNHTLTNVSGCDSIVSLNLTINNSPSIAVNSGSICSANSFTINPTGANTYTITGGLSVVSPTSNATYSITGTSTQGCVSSNTAVSSVTVNASPTISVNSGSICSGNSFTINPSGASSFTISGGSAIVTPTTNTSYNVTGTSVQGCVSSNTAVSSVTVNSIPVISVNSGSICSGSSFTINPTGANTYTISGGGSVVTPTSNATYSITGTSAQGCVSSNTAVSSVTVNAIPLVSVNSGSICSGNSFTINPTGASTYTINGGSTVVTPTTNTSYNVTGTSAQGCVSSNTAISSVTVNAKPTISVNSGSICSGNSFTINPGGAATYTISGGSYVVSPTSNTSYSVAGSSIDGCISSNTAISSVSVNALPSLSVASTNSLMCSGESSTLTVTGASTYTWNTTENTSAISISPTVTTTYTVNGIDANGCENSSTITQSVSLCTGIASIKKDELISIYPNPTNGSFTISEIEVNANISIYNTIGELVKSIQSTDNSTIIDLSDYSNGIYFIKIKNNEGEAIQKLIKY